MKKAILLTAALIMTITGCAGDYAYREGERLLQEGKTVEGLKQLEQAVIEEPNNVQYRSALIQSREAHIQGLIRKGDAALQAGRYEEAGTYYREVLKMHAENPRAQSGLQAIDTMRQNRVLLEEAKQAIARGEHEKARSKLRAVLAQQPGQQEAVKLLKQVEEKTGKAKGADFPKLAEAFQRPVTLEFRDANIKTLFDALSRKSGINFVFDKDVKTDARLTIFARDTPIIDALDMLLRTGQLAKKILNDKTLLIYPATAAKHKEYQELVVKGFFLSNTEAKQAVNLVRSMAKTRDIYVDEKLNLLVVRDTPEAIRLVEKLVALADRPEPEVMLEIEILEVKRTRLQELGVQWPTQFSVIPLGGEEALLTLNELRNLSSSDIGVFPRPSVRISKDTSDVNLLANPRIRVKNKEKAKIHIGDKVPVITSNVTSTGVTSESVSYLDVGLKVDVEPLVHLENDVGIKVGLEVSNIVRSVTTDNGTLVYQLGSRNANTVLRLKDGETQILAGLISDEDRTGSNRVPGFGDLPLLGRLFSTQTDDLIKTEIVLLITPRIIRNIERPELIDGEFFAGTESTASDQPLQLRPAVARPSARPGTQEEAADEPDTDDEPPAQPEPPAPATPGAAPAQ